MRYLSILALIIVASVAFTSCRKSYTCTCDTVQIDGTSTKLTHDMKKQSYEDANDFCERYEDDLNTATEGTTGCHL